MLRIRIFFARWSRFEYWPLVLFYLPLLPAYLYYAIRSRSPVYFTAVNPGIEHGGFFGEHKERILSNVDKRFLPATYFFPLVQRAKWVELLQNISNDHFPVVFKPNIGERGDEVRIFDSKDQLQSHISTVEFDFLIQRYISFPIELGVLYHRSPGAQKGEVLSITRKGFMTVTGDGKRSVEELMMSRRRYLLQVPRFRVEKPELLKIIPQKGEELMLDNIGNHCLGTEFIDANDWINDKVNSVFDQVTSTFDGFFYGRIDLKVPSREDLEAGENIRIFEINGVSSEPGHIYDRRYSVFRAYSELYRTWGIIFSVAVANRKLGIPYSSVSELIRISWRHFFVSKRM